MIKIGSLGPVKADGTISGDVVTFNMNFQTVEEAADIALKIFDSIYQFPEGFQFSMIEN